VKTPEEHADAYMERLRALLDADGDTMHGLGPVRRRSLRRAIYAIVAEAAEEEREACAATCERIWKEAPNVRPHYIQNRIADGCLESAAAIRARSAPPRKGDA